jgi:hypothetical protein
VLAYLVEWRTREPSSTALEVDCPELGSWTLDDPSHRGTRHEVFVMGLAPGAQCELTARAGSGSSILDERSTSIEVGDLPGFLPELEVTVPDTEGAAQQGWTLTNLHNRFDQVPYTVALIDLQGRYRWYYQASVSVTGDDTPVVRLDNGVAFGGRGVPTTVIDWRGNVKWRGPTGHHEVQPTGEPGHLYIWNWASCPDMEYDGSKIVELDWQTDERVWEWKTCEHYTPDPEFPDWAHENTVAPFGAPPFGDEDALIISLREQHSVMKVDRSTEQIVWNMGFAGRPSDGFRGDFAMAQADRFYKQHDPEVTRSGNIVLFDNGHAELRPHSRAIEIEYEYNPSGESTAQVVWEYRPDPDVFTPIWGDADRLGNGNTLVTFGETQLGKTTRIVEASAQAEAEVVWELRMPPKWGAYRAERVTDLPRGHVVPPETDG